MCSGLRDAWNLGWKLDRVLSGKSSDRLLDDYEKERGPHVEAYIRISMEMGKVVCVPDPEAARGRDAAFFNGLVPPPPPAPGIYAGLIAKDPDGKPGIGAGELLPHDLLASAAETERLDALVGRDFYLLSNAGTDEIPSQVRARADAMGVKLIILGEGNFRDVAGRLSGFLRERGVVAVLGRPDFYAFGAARAAGEIDSLLARLDEGLSHAPST
jgi:hypothetical protein